jgi:hypothetical protein
VSDVRPVAAARPHRSGLHHGFCEGGSMTTIFGIRFAPTGVLSDRHYFTNKGAAQDYLRIFCSGEDFEIVPIRVFDTFDEFTVGFITPSILRLPLTDG